MKDYLIHAINPNKHIRVLIAKTTNAVEEMRNLHGLSPTATAAMGRLFTASTLLASQMKNEQDVATFILNGYGKIGQMVVVADAEGHAKAYCDEPAADVPSKDGHLDVGGLVGTDGYLRVIKDLGLKEPYTGQVALVNGEVGMDFAQYLYTSEQVESVVSLGVLVEKDLHVAGAGGFIIQLMPDADEEDVALVEATIKGLEPVSSMMARELSPEDVAQTALAPLELTVLQSKDIHLQCDCSREKMERALLALGPQELESMMEEEEATELTCHFCHNVQQFSKEELQELIHRAQE